MCSLLFLSKSTCPFCSSLKGKFMEDKEKDTTELTSGEDSTKYGEFISSFHEWVPPEKQKEKSHELENVTRVNKERNSKRNTDK